MNSYTLWEDEVYRRAEKDIREGDIERLYERMGYDGIHHYSWGMKLLIDDFGERLREALADYDTEAVGLIVTAIIWDVYLADAESDMDDEQWEPTYVGED